MRKLIYIIAVLVTVLIGLNLVQGSAELNDKSNKSDWPMVNASHENISESTVATGTVKSKVGAEVKVGSQVSGVVSKLFVNVGDYVEKGQLLALLDDSTLRTRVDFQKAELNSAVAEYEYARAEVARFERLQAYIPAAQLEDSRRNLAVRAARITQIKASLAESAVQLEFYKIVAPISGVIASVSTYEGETVAASFAAPTFVTIVDLSRLEIQSYVDETDIGQITIGQEVVFRVDAHPGEEIGGIVRAIYPKPELINNVVNYIVILDMLEKPEFLMRPEMTARVNFILQQKNNVLCLPRSAVLREGNESYVLVAGADGWSKQLVGTGLRTPQRIEITSNLAERQSVLANVNLWKEAEKNNQ